jgi:hypothetical protein
MLIRVLFGVLSALLISKAAEAQEWVILEGSNQTDGASRDYIRIERTDGTATWQELEKIEIYQFEEYSAGLDIELASNPDLVRWQRVPIFGLDVPEISSDVDLPSDFTERLRTDGSGTTNPIGYEDIGGAPTTTRVATSNEETPSYYHGAFARAWRKCSGAHNSARCLIRNASISCRSLRSTRLYACHSAFIEYGRPVLPSSEG